tara:strand:- start:281 stop:1336 length:1056 start_codon:yes stop_codon:yes gene_type:complete
MIALLKLLLFLSLLLGQGLQIPKIEYNPRSYVCYKTSAPILIDGKLNDPSWSKTDWTESFVDIEGNLKPDPFYDTKVKMLWDDNYFYFGAEMEEPHIWATLTARDAVIFKDNDFEIFLDPDGDTHNYYELEVNALETEWDLLLLKPYRDQAKVAVDSWDIPGLITKVHVDGTLNDPLDMDKGWTLEIAVPWKGLEECAPNLYPNDGEQWKINFSRVQWDINIEKGSYVKTDLPEFNWVWSPQGIINMHYPEMWGLVQFSETIVGKEKIEYLSNKLDIVKWAMRHIYYRQRNYYEVYNNFTASLKKLELQEIPVAGVPWPPEIVLTPSGWEAALKWDQSTVIIITDGKVWVK